MDTMSILFAIVLIAGVAFLFYAAVDVIGGILYPAVEPPHVASQGFIGWNTSEGVVIEDYGDK